MFCYLIKTLQILQNEQTPTADGQTDCKNVSKNSIHEIDADLNKKKRHVRHLNDSKNNIMN